MAGNLGKVFELLNRRIGQKVKKGERDVARRYAKALVEIRVLIAKRYERYERDGKLTFEEMAKFDRLNKLMREVNHVLKVLYKDIYKQMPDLLGDLYKDGYHMTAWAIETDAKTKLNYSSVTSTQILSMLNNPVAGLTLKERLERNRAAIIYTIQQEVTQGLVAGETYSTMSKRLKGSLEGDAAKSVRIARTESHRVVESAKHDSVIHANRQGVKMFKTWQSSDDERVRTGISNHRKIDGKTIPVDSLFDDGNCKGLSPGMLLGVNSAKSNINCRCFLTYEIKNIEKPQHADLEKMTFENWKKERISL